MNLVELFGNFTAAPKSQQYAKRAADELWRTIEPIRRQLASFWISPDPDPWPLGSILAMDEGVPSLPGAVLSLKFEFKFFISPTPQTRLTWMRYYIP